MDFKKINNTWILRIDKGENIVSSIKNFCKDNNIKLGSISAIGAATNIKIGYFDLNTKVYNETVFDGKYEITSLLGNLTTKDNEPYLHLHINFSGEDCVTYGGHFVEGTVTAVCEIILTELDGQITRYLDEVSGLNVMNLK
ncbi:PPC domain-containing DNA-binding protein [Clostridium sp.]|uniref:PPC domain-containing DNA-binding protein n=1 Tax=Clostridium sp. TaxID=1506 RepID=UPI0026DBB3AB|nr:PPC domain-containing DNA-binding protein [Clostridium sp.]MDO5039421.1 DNA-binding protein [Clostridium sp.]